MTQSLESLLAEGLAAQGIECDQPTQGRLIAFVHLLQKWNKVYNLTAVRDPRQMVIRHVLDSLSVLQYLLGPRILDVGAGAGLPGLPLALLSPQYRFVECDSVAKKTRFIQHAVSELGIDNVSVKTARIESLWDDQQLGKGQAEQYDTVISRAFASLTDMIAKAGPMCRVGGRLLAMKGACPEQELAEIPHHFALQAVETLEVYGLNEQRTLIQLERCQ